MTGTNFPREQAARDLAEIAERHQQVARLASPLFPHWYIPLLALTVLLQGVASDVPLPAGLVARLLAVLSVPVPFLLLYRSRRVVFRLLWKAGDFLILLGWGVVVLVLFCGLALTLVPEDAEYMSTGFGLVGAGVLIITGVPLNWWMSRRVQKRFGMR